MPYKDHEKQLEYLRKWRREHPDYWRKWYHQKQDEIGYHGDPRTVYPGYRFLKALADI